MTEKQQKITRLIYGIVMSVLTITAGVLLIVQSQRIYHTPDRYSREIVGKYLGEISAVLYIWIAAVVVGAILWQVIPPTQTKLRGTIYQTDVLTKMKRRLPLCVESEKLHRAEIIKKTVWIVAIAFGILATVMVGLVVFDKNYYHLEASEFNPMQDMLDMLPDFMPWVASAFFVAIGVSIYTELSAKYEVNEIKRLIIESKKTPSQSSKDSTYAPTLKEKILAHIPEKLKTENFRRYALLGTRVSLAIVAIVFVIVGVINGGLLAVLEKATAICRECIGLG